MAGFVARYENVGGKLIPKNPTALGHCSFRWSLREGNLRSTERPVEAKKLLEGTYVVLTEEKDLSPPESVRAYKEFSEVERAFGKLKGVLELRPIDHQTPRRVQAHIFVSALAFLLDRLLEKKLRAAKLPLSSEQAWVARAG